MVLSKVSSSAHFLQKTRFSPKYILAALLPPHLFFVLLCQSPSWYAIIEGQFTFTLHGIKTNYLRCRSYSHIINLRSLQGFLCRCFLTDMSYFYLLAFEYPNNFFLWQRKTGTVCSHLLFVILYLCQQFMSLGRYRQGKYVEVMAIAELRTLSVSWIS